MSKKKINVTEIDMYKIALFLVIKNSSVLPMCMKSKKTMREINEISVATMDKILEYIDYDLAVEQYLQGGGIMHGAA